MNRVENLLLRDVTVPGDVERYALFLILGGNDDLYFKVDYIYNFEEHTIKASCLENDEVDFSSSSKSLIQLAFNLFNGFPCDVLNTFNNLDSVNFALAISAIKIRFSEDI